jgi:hypothetical protein
MDILIAILFVWLFFKALGLAFRVAWSTTKFVASLLFAIAVPLLVVCMFFAGGFFLLLPLALVGIAFGLLKTCV